ncbi:amidase [Bifidobacterium sp. DSM 109958]|uniref:Amidase n=1 Tax=Bifidobacterium moraviense TaxID=2675323 RepID=A0A7Y0HZB1_9BIFI|nr:CHAP domain-containing protein [Bifidobacterium sp. DSM 109958]NMN01237.1 amidase [Bifidobacterium sp. DSM 109958]
MTVTKRSRAVIGWLLCAATLTATGVAGMNVGVTEAQAVPSYSEYQQKVASANELKAQLAGASADLQEQIIALDDLTENQIPAAQDAVDQANAAAETAKAAADAAAERLKAAQKDREDLQAKIDQTGADYDDAQAAVAQLARESFHGSDASKVMSVVTNASTADDFVQKMQADAAVTRSEANAANDAATDLNTSMNRGQRLEAIEQEITTLKAQADQESAAAQQAAADAQAKQQQLNALREEGDKKRAELESRVEQLKDASAKEAAEVVLMKSQIDSYNEQLAAAQKAAQEEAAKNATQGQDTSASKPSSRPSSSGSSNSGSSSKPSSGGSSNSGSSSSGSSSGSSSAGMNYSVPGNCAPYSSSCYGHATHDISSTYPVGQCTWWAYLRRHQLNLPVGTQFGNGKDWANSARSYGYYVNSTPHVGAIMVFRAGQLGVSAQYGHVAIVERINADGSVYISESGSGFGGRVHYRNIQNPGNFQYIHT